MNEFWQGIREGWLGAAWAEQLATLLGVTGVWLMMRQIIWAFPVGLVQVTLFAWVCWQGRLYSEVVLQGVFFAALVYGWVHWVRGGTQAQPLPVTTLSGRTRGAVLVVILLVWVGWGTAMHRYTDADLAYADAFVLACSIVAQWLQARKKLENWIGWLVANTVAVGVFWLKGWYWFTFLYAVFWIMAWGGLAEWRRSMRGNRP